MSGKTPYQRIVLAAKLGVGVHLTPHECAQMSIDTAISELAMNDDEAEEFTKKVIRDAKSAAVRP